MILTEPGRGVKLQVQMSAELTRAERDLVEAIEYAQSYVGDFEFMLSMKASATKSGWQPTRAQVRAILSCRGHDTGQWPDTRTHRVTGNARMTLSRPARGRAKFYRGAN